jgi:hypothetical protein
MGLTLPTDAQQGDQTEHNDDYHDGNCDESGSHVRECRTSARFVLVPRHRACLVERVSLRDARGDGGDVFVAVRLKLHRLLKRVSLGDRLRAFG